jgi:fatty-acyl-CoA synthase
MSDTVTGLPSTFQDDYALNMTEFVRSTARNLSEREIVSGTGSDQFRYTYGEAYERMQRLANALEGLGVEPGDRIGVLAWNDHRHYETYFAVPGTGGAFLQFNLRLHPETLRYVADYAEPRFLFVDETLLEMAESVAAETDSIEGVIVMADGDIQEADTDLGPIHSYETLLEEASPEYDWPTIDEDLTAVICYTTGTTGRPKAVCYSHRSNYLFAMQMANTYEVTHDSATLVLTPMFHIQGGGIPVVATYAGAKLVLPGEYSLEDPGPITELMVDEGITFSSGVPLIYRTILQYLREDYDQPVDFGGTKFMIGGAAPSWELIAG